jgi:hypothetical protein
MEGATLQQLRNLRARMLLYMMMGAILVQKLPPINLRALLVSSAFDFITLPY